MRIDRVARGMKKRASVAVRVNPNVDAGTHSKITTGTFIRAVSWSMTNANRP